MKPIFEHVAHNPGNSFFLSHSSHGCTEPFWHIHPEYEIVYVRNGSGNQHVGSHFSKYTDGTLLLIGPNLPHSNMGNYDFKDNSNVVIQMSSDFLERKVLGFSEFLFIKELLLRSNQGISFGKSIKKKLSSKIEELHNMASYERLITLITILKDLSNTNDYTLLNANAIHIKQHSNYNYRVNKINNYVAKNYHRPIQIIELANLIGLTESSFSRFFKEQPGNPLLHFLMNIVFIKRVIF